MSDALVISHLLLWASVVVLAGVVVALVRQIGVLHERLAPAGALMLARGPKPGEAAPRVRAELLGGGVREIGAPRADGRGTLLFFVSPSCPVCKTLLPAVRALARRERARVELVLASDGPRDEHDAFVRAERLEEVPYLVSGPLGLAYEVSKLPFAAVIDAGGVLRARGIVSTREHLESLLEADALGVATIQDWAAERGHGAGHERGLHGAPRGVA